ncbi:pentapeptide repeat-containing protein [Candidatus Gracilibacteria bacterium]|nr:pentapeptide repeat-containing protein [Candidatus Gracilibacteria bacterium]
MNQQLDEKDFEQALLSNYITGKYISKQKWVIDDIFEKYTFENLELIKGSFTCSLFQNCTFVNIVFEEIHLDECDFKNCNFQNVIFKNCTTENIQFINCIDMPKIL